MKVSNFLPVLKSIATKFLSSKSLAVSLCLLLYPITVTAAPNYAVSEIPYSPDSGQPFFADMNGDGKQDILIGHWNAQQGRELFIYLQQENGLFAAEPSRRVEIKPEIIAVTTAELGENPGDELIFLTSDAVYSFSSNIQRYSGNLKKLIDWPLIAATPHRKQLFYFGKLPDVNNDGISDLLLPYDEGVAYFQGFETKQFSLQSTIKTIGLENYSKQQGGISFGINNKLLDDEGNIVLNVTSPSSSHFNNFITQWKPDSLNSSSNNSLVRTNKWTPSIVLASLVDSAKTDIIYFNANSESESESDKKGHLYLFTQNESGQFTQRAEWQNILNNDETIRLVDFNGDGLDDLIKIHLKGNDSTIYFYQNKSTNFSFDAPDQVMRFSGLDLEVHFIDLNKDAKPELSISFYTLPVLDMIRNPKVKRTRLLFSNNGSITNSSLDSEQKIFSRRPDFSLVESFSADAFLALNPTGSLEHDINGDGQVDYLHLAKDGTVKAQTIQSNPLRVEEEGFWQYVPNHAVLNIGLEELNNDSSPDLILFHSLHFTLLVSIK